MSRPKGINAVCGRCGHTRGHHVWPAAPEDKYCGKLLSSTEPGFVRKPCPCPEFVSPLCCSVCNAPHDFDLAPDTGDCIICGGKLIEDEEERVYVSGEGFNKAVVGAVTDGLAAVAKIRGKAPRGDN